MSFDGFGLLLFEYEATIGGGEGGGNKGVLCAIEWNDNSKCNFIRSWDAF